MRRRDPLLGPVPHRDGKVAGASTKTMWLILLIAVVAAGAAVALAVAVLSGRAREAELAGPSEQVLAKPEPARNLVRNSVVTTAPKVAAEPAFRLQPVQEADWEKLGSRCNCRFHLGRSSPELLIAGGDNLAIFRPEGERKICPMTEEQFGGMYEGAARIDCGTSQLVIRAYGRTTPGFDAHSTAAKLTVVYGGNERVFDGRFDCGC